MDGNFNDNGRHPDPAAAIGVAEVRAMLDLNNALNASAPDPVVGKRVLLAGVCRVVAADSAMAVVNRLDEKTGRAVVVSVATTFVDSTKRAIPAAAHAAGQVGNNGHGSRTELPAAGDVRGQASSAEALRRRAGIDSCIDAPLSLDGVRVVAWLTVGRRAGERERFTPRHRAIIELMHAASGWLYARDLFLASPDALALPPPQYEVLRRVMAGEANAQIASTLRVSPAIVRARVASICRRLGVPDRGRLEALGGARSAGVVE